ncbi:MAG TPA: hypothetical protein VJY41_00995, partial [Prolixibacteraceae bacterium]|nr:hypothetical protein [Prolixibacteraceae bacterium]
PKIKYLDGKELFASSEQPNLMSREDINMIIFTDQENLKLVNSGEQLNAVFSNENLQAVSEQLNAGFTATEQLGLFSNEKLGTALVLPNIESLGAIFFNIENLGVFLNNEKLGAVYAQ